MAAANSGSVGRGRAFVVMGREQINREQISNLKVREKTFPIRIVARQSIAPNVIHEIVRAS